MILLLCFFSGIIFISFLFPIFESFTTLICNQLEYLSSKIVQKIYIIRDELQDSLEQSDTSSNPMGFHVYHAESEEIDQE